MKNKLVVLCFVIVLCGSNIITYYMSNQEVQALKVNLASVLSEYQKSTAIENNNENPKNKVNSLREKPILTTSVKIIESDKYWDSNVMNNISDRPIYKKGFLSIPSQKKWLLQIYNPTQRDISNVSVNYAVTTFENHITFGIDELDIVAYQPRKYKEMTNNIQIENVDNNALIELDLFYMATFPQVKIEISSIMVNEEPINNEPMIYYYCSDAFESIGDMQDLRQLLGLTNTNGTEEGLQ